MSKYRPAEHEMHKIVLRTMSDVKRRAFEFAVRDGEKLLAQKLWNEQLKKYLEAIEEGLMKKDPTPFGVGSLELAA